LWPRAKRHDRFTTDFHATKTGQIKERKMKTLLRITLALLVLGAALAVPMPGNAQKKVREKTVVGYISDNHCGLKHMEGMESDKACVLMCVANGKFVLADRDHKKVYQLDKVGQDKARGFAGQKVRITGRITGKTIRVIAIEAA
jgi:hypothetical protein